MHWALRSDKPRKLWYWMFVSMCRYVMSSQLHSAAFNYKKNVSINWRKKYIQHRQILGKKHHISNTRQIIREMQRIRYQFVSSFTSGVGTLFCLPGQKQLFFHLHAGHTLLKMSHLFQRKCNYINLQLERNLSLSSFFFFFNKLNDEDLLE